MPGRAWGGGGVLPKTGEPSRPPIPRLAGEAVIGGKMKGVCMNLKVCEGCGALWLRAPGAGVYCMRCAAIFAEFPNPRGQSRRGRRPRVAVVLRPSAEGTR